ncbi:hypothetical protein [Paramicrobacterium fandaimingii]|uniref:hypothetical protein n=1 Tax=Paramicrobacterium fandaimingii TaxID=2708079 RepID=UPI0014204A9A|nr:hypothetical protein [Microbacterium fandaimingii]
MRADTRTKKLAELLHSEVRAIRAFHDETLREDTRAPAVSAREDAPTQARQRRTRRLKKSLELVDVLLGSILDILGPLLDAASAGTITMAREALKAFI